MDNMCSRDNVCVCFMWRVTRIF